jgi:hypothetical protein
MEKMSRRNFVKLAGAGSAVAAASAAGVPLAAHALSKRSGVLRFSATGGLPKKPLPSYATHVVDGSVDLTTGTGLVNSRVLAGHPGEPSMIGLPGLSRIYRITDVVADGPIFRLHGIVEDRSQLRRGESTKVEILVDQHKKLVHVPFSGNPSTLSLGS